ncbi:MAG: ABC transporter ATP-binding protein [Betaproteobacteria bacterium]|jgi:lipopolysaccharide transport system ATP-binding protein
MSSEAIPAMIECRDLAKAYTPAHSTGQRFWQLLWGRANRVNPYWALHGVSFTLGRGEVLGVVGCNGAGKSTLLQLLCGTLSPTVGEVVVRGRVAALLELGAGFNPDFTGRENAVLNAALLGLSAQEVQRKLPDILAFADIGHFIDEPVKTYSSGMFVRLAFAVAVSVEPEILIIDEALSVGDGAFARKSFERIMELKRRGATILFCSHSLYQVEALCERALWLNAGRVQAMGSAADVCAQYQSFLNGLAGLGAGLAVDRNAAAAHAPEVAAPAGAGRITGFVMRCGEQVGTEVSVRSGQDDVSIEIRFVCDPALPCPSLALGISDQNGLTISSALSLMDAAPVRREADGRGQATLLLERLPLLKGRYSLTPFLLSEDGLHPYDQVLHAGHIRVSQEGPLQGVVSLPRRWV